MQTRRRSGLLALVCALAVGAAAAGVRSVPTSASDRRGPGSGGAPPGDGPIPFDPATLPGFPPWIVEHALTVILGGGALVVVLYVLLVVYEDGLAGLLELVVRFSRTIVVAVLVGLVLALPLFLGMDLASAVPDVPSLVGGGQEGGSAGGDTDATGGLPGWVLPVAILAVLGAASFLAYRVFTDVVADEERRSGGADGRGAGSSLDAGGPARAIEFEDVAAGNAVYRAWAALADEVLPTHRRTATPAEVAEAARGDDRDGEAVAALTAAFEEIRYGDRDVTEDRERRAAEAAAALGLEEVTS